MRIINENVNITANGIPTMERIAKKAIIGSKKNVIKPANKHVHIDLRTLKADCLVNSGNSAIKIVPTSSAPKKSMS